MKVDQLYTNCLAQAAYYIESNGEAAVIDPLREPAPYLELAKRDNAKIRYVFETHFHADFVSGHVDLAEKTGATIVYGPTLQQTGFPCLVAKDGQEFKIGAITIRLIHTPGHTMESSCFLLIDENGREHALFTGDTLFIGDVGRPDLAQKIAADLTPEKLAGHLFHSLREKIMPLHDDLIIYPGHGAGSACGKNLGRETVDTLGHQKKSNYALNPSLTEATFKQAVLEGLTAPPGYFPADVLLNIRGYEPIDHLILHSCRPIPANQFHHLHQYEDVMVIDTRSPEAFAEGFVPGAINIGIDGDFAIWAGTLISPVSRRIMLVCDNGREREAVTRLARVGFDHVEGYLQNGMDGWKKADLPVDHLEVVSPLELKALMMQRRLTLIDGRRQAEFESGHLPEAINVPLDYVINHLHRIPSDHKCYVYCAGGYRSSIFVSVLRSRGYLQLVNVSGGYSGIKKTGMFEEERAVTSR